MMVLEVFGGYLESGLLVYEMSKRGVKGCY